MLAVGSQHVHGPPRIVVVVVVAVIFCAPRLSANDPLTPTVQTTPGAAGPAAVTALVPAPSTAPLMAWAEQSFAAAAIGEQHGQASCVDAYYQCAAYSLQVVEHGLTRSPRDARFDRAWSLYHMSLAKVIQLGQLFGRLDARRGLKVNTPTGAILIPISYHGFSWVPGDFQRVVVVGEYHSPSPRQVYRRPGLGVPLIVIRERGTPGDFLLDGQPFAATAVLRLPPSLTVGGAAAGGPPAAPSVQSVLELYDPQRVKCVSLHGANLALAGDLTAPLSYAWMTVKRDPIRNRIQPGTSRAEPELAFLEPYQPGKIPLVFVHGLLSDPLTWVDLANELQMREQVLNRYQVWAFRYPTGRPFLGPAADFRNELLRAVAAVDPGGADPALRQMVLVGHSMGGLVSKLLVTHSGNLLWSQFSGRPLQHINTTAEIKSRLASIFFFEPHPYVRRVVFIGTPHGGSSLASQAIGRLGSSWIRPPSEDELLYRNLLSQNPGAFNPAFQSRLPTSIDLLQPSDPLLIAIRNLPVSPRVQLHSIIGYGHRVLFSGDGDGAVPVSSAWHPGVSSEQFVMARHTELHRHPQTVNGLLQILAIHAARYDAEIATPGRGR
jgi:pimeloyl-ACP methyl ester carboxylesterase